MQGPSVAHPGLTVDVLVDWQSLDVPGLASTAPLVGLRARLAHLPGNGARPASKRGRRPQAPYWFAGKIMEAT